MRFEFDFLNGRPIDLSPPSPVNWCELRGYMNWMQIFVEFTFYTRAKFYFIREVMFSCAFCLHIECIRFGINRRLINICIRFPFCIVHAPSWCVCMRVCMCGSAWTIIVFLSIVFENGIWVTVALVLTIVTLVFLYKRTCLFRKWTVILFLFQPFVQPFNSFPFFLTL